MKCVMSKKDISDTTGEVKWESVFENANRKTPEKTITIKSNLKTKDRKPNE